MIMMTLPENKFQTQLFQTSCASPLGEIILMAHDAALIGLWLDGQKHFARGVENQPRTLRENQILAQTKIWLAEYFRGENPNPREIPLDPHGTDFQHRVWKILAEIPYGETMTYGEIAQKIAAQNPNIQIARKTLAQNSPKRAMTFPARAVGGAVGRNPISILIPCHRVVGAGGKLTGYAGGLDKKRALLKLENPNRARFC